MYLCMYPLGASNSYSTTLHLTSVCSHVDKTPLPDFPHRPIDFLQVWRDVGNVSYTATISNNMIPDLSGEVDGDRSRRKQSEWVLKKNILQNSEKSRGEILNAYGTKELQSFPLLFMI